MFYFRQRICRQDMGEEQIGSWRGSDWQTVWHPRNFWLHWVNDAVDVTLPRT